MRVATFSAVIGLALCAAKGQPASREAFEVATVKPAEGECGGSVSRTSTGLHAFTDLRRLLEFAYQTKQLDMSRVPAALQKGCFEIEAKAAQKITGDQHWEMLQELLEDRFHLAYHRETTWAARTRRKAGRHDPGKGV
jgi:uncharacterized protein (TIGR03435 family)